MWTDGSRIPLPTDPWHTWYEGQPDNVDSLENCVVISNYQYWAIRKQTMDNYVWLVYACHHNAEQAIQGYICERRCCSSYSKLIYYLKVLTYYDFRSFYAFVEITPVVSSII